MSNRRRRLLAAAALLLLLLLPGPRPAIAGDEWTSTDTALQVVGSSLALVEWAQTRVIADNPDRYHEHYNPLLGEHPDRSRVDAYFAASMVGHYLVARSLPHPWRTAWQSLQIGVCASMVGINYRIGIRVEL